MGVYLYQNNSELAIKNAYIGEYEFETKYQEVEYIQGNAVGCSIDTGVILGGNNFQIEVDFSITSWGPNEQPLASIWTSTYSYWNMFIGDTSGSVYRFDVYTAGHHDTTNIALSTKYKAILNRTATSSWNVSLNEWTTSWSYTPGSTNNTTVKLFRRGDGNVPSSPSTIRMYGCKINVGGVIQRDLLPCYRKSDNVIGLYDLANNQFYTNSGTGTFTKGPDVN